jgi:hypothetical protein
LQNGVSKTSSGYQQGEFNGQLVEGTKSENGVFEIKTPLIMPLGFWH